MHNGLNIILQVKIQAIGGVYDCLDPVLGTGHRGYPQDTPYSLPVAPSPSCWSMYKNTSIIKPLFDT